MSADIIYCYLQTIRLRLPPPFGQVTESGGFHADEWIVEASSIRRPDDWGWFIHTTHKHDDDLGMVYDCFTHIIDNKLKDYDL